MLKCENIQTETSAYLDREMPLWKMELIKWHLGHCPTCAREVARIRQTNEILHRLDRVKTSDNFVSDVIHRASEARASEKLRTSRIHRIWWRLESAMAWPRHGVLRRAPSFAFTATFALLLVLGTFATLYYPRGTHLSWNNAQLVVQSPAEDSSLVWIDIISAAPPKRYLSINQRSTSQPGPNISNQGSDSRRL